MGQQFGAVGPGEDAVDQTIGGLAHAREARKFAHIGQQEGQRPGCEIETAHALDAFDRLRLAKSTAEAVQGVGGKGNHAACRQHADRLLQDRVGRL